MRFFQQTVFGVSMAAAAAACFGQGAASQKQASPAHSRLSAGRMSVEQQKAFVDQYCSDCHNSDVKRGGMTISDLDLDHPGQSDELAEKVLRRVGVSFMPPPGAKHPDPATRKEFVQSLAANVDADAKLHPYYGNPSLHRMNREEYANSIRDLLGVNIDVDEMLPADTFDHGFDNMSDVLTVTPTLMTAYIRAAGKVSRLAIGDRNAAPGSVTFVMQRVENQVVHEEGTPFGTRGGTSVVYDFPANGNYTFTVSMFASLDGPMFGATAGNTQQVEISINGVPAALLPIKPATSKFDIIRTKPIYVQAGPQRVAAAFLNIADGPVDDAVEPGNFSLLDLNQATLPGITNLPHMQEFTIAGPTDVNGIAETPSRKLIFSCYPKTAAEEEPCARKILTRLAAQAYRRPVSANETAGLMRIYSIGRNDASFEDGVSAALQAILASPSFIFRFERNHPLTTEASVKKTAMEETAGGVTAYPITDLELASRLSFFLWSDAPDAELLSLAQANRLHRPEVLEAQVRRMLKDPRSIAISNDFASQWLHLQNLKSSLPDGYLFPLYSQNLIHDMREETILFFNSVVKEDRPVLTLLNGNYTFLNQDLARLYNVPNVYGERFRRVTLTDENRFGLMGKASLLTLTSAANRTSPTIRGKYIMEVILGTPPPPPPPNVPALKDHGDNGNPQTVRALLEEHRKNPTCAGCHKFMDPIGFALETFDPIGGTRSLDSGAPIDSTGKLYDGSPLDGPASLRKALMDHSDAFLGTFTENLFAYGMGRVIVPQDMPTIRSIERYSAARNNTFSAIVLGIVNSPPFLMRTAEPVSPEEKRMLTTRMVLPASRTSSPASQLGIASLQPNR